MITHIDLFAGIGGFSLVAHAVGMTTILQVENDLYCQKVLKKHAKSYWSKAIIASDIRGVSAQTYPHAVGADVITAGFPCQPHSQAGRILGEHDPRELWGDTARCISDFAPRAIVLENVPNICNTIGLRVVKDLTLMGYDSTWGIIPAFDAGAPHKRARWVLVAYANGIGLEARRNRLAQNRIDSELQGEIQRPTQPCGVAHTVPVHQHGKNGRAPYNANRMDGRVNGVSSGLHTHQFPPTPNNWRAMAYPDDPKGTRKARIHALGNAIVPQVFIPIMADVYRWLIEAKNETL
jgi:DNA (cytosine-5)-methyltransferase 1